jgi:hypothetical protein
VNPGDLIEVFSGSRYLAGYLDEDGTLSEIKGRLVNTICKIVATKSVCQEDVGVVWNFAYVVCSTHVGWIYLEPTVVRVVS